MSNKQKKCVIINDEKILKDVHKACYEYFSNLPEEKLKNHFKIILSNT